MWTGTRLAVVMGVLAGALPGAEEPEWTVRQVPGGWEGAGIGWYRCWVKVPAHWTEVTGAALYRESVTLSLPGVEDPHEVFVNGERLGGARGFPPDLKEPEEGMARYKVRAGLLGHGEWNEVAVRLYHPERGGGMRREAPSIQGYFLEGVLAGEWEFRPGDGAGWAGKARTAKPEAAAYEQFHEASRVLGEAKELVRGARLSPEESLGMMATDDDLVVEELLSEPLVAQPTHLSYDDRGRLWVSQYRQYPYPAGLKQVSRDKYYRAKYDQEPQAPPHHHRGRSRISVHEDTDGDGRYDVHKVFADGLDLANAALPDQDGIWVMHTPYLLFYPDADRDDIPDGDPEVHLAGFGFEDTHSVANGLVWGPDGWIYGGQGSTVASRIVRPGVDGEDAPGVYFEGCMVWRYEPATRRFEIFAEGGGNVFGLEFDGDGRLFSGHNGGDTRGWHYVQGGYLLKQGRSPEKFGPAANPHAFGDLDMMRSSNPVVRFSHNVIVCEGTAVPTRLRGCFLAADPLHHHLVLSERRVRGSTFETGDLGEPLRSGDPAFRPVYLSNAPDGSVHLADFYDFYIAHGQHYQSQIDPSTGRVYRLRGKGNELERATDLASLPSAELVMRLGHPNKWHRQTAVRLLGQRGGESGVRAALADWIRAHSGREALDGLWALKQAGGFDEEVALETLRHPYPPVRAWTIRLLGDGGALTPRLTEELRDLAGREEDREVWSQLASTVQRVPAATGLPILGELLARSGDLDDPNLPLMFWWAIEKHCEAGRGEVLALFDRAAIRSQGMVRRELLPRVMRRFAVSGAEADLLICARLLEQAEGEEEREFLMAGFERAFEGGALPNLPPELLAAMGSGSGLSLVLRVRAGEEGAVREALAAVGDAGRKTSERLLLIRTLGEIAPEAGRSVLLDWAGREGDVAIRRAALSALRGYDGPEVGAAVLALYPSLGAGELAVAQGVLASRESWSRQWLEAIEAGGIAAGGVSREAVLMMRRHEDGEVRRLLDKHFGEVVAPRSGAAEAERIREIVGMAPGSPYRGAPLFKERCAACHVLFYAGGRIGPDLTNYQRDDLETMLTSVVDPNAEIREGYEGYAVRMADGRLLSGFVADGGERVVTLRGFEGSDFSLPREQIAEMTPLGRSLMPEGLLEGLGEQELRDLFAYLRSAQPFTAE